MIDYNIFYYIPIILILFYYDYERYKWLFKTNNVLLIFFGVCSIILIKHFIRHD